MKKSVLKRILTTIIVVTMLSTTAFASFSDVNATTYSWAIEAINSMADAGIINGYGDGTFGPEKSISKLEGLSLISRILGCNDEDNEYVTSEAMVLYEETIDSYDLSFGQKELSYLLFKGVIDEEELEDYVADGSAGDGLKRYEVAVLLTKALDGERNLASSAALDYTDASDIPAAAKKHVKYVTDNGLMNGMGNGEFSPNTNVTRAQAAVVLKKLQNMTSYQFRSGTVSEMNLNTGNISIKSDDGSVYSHSIMQNVILRFEGKEITKKDITTGSIASITYKDAQLYAIDFMASAADSMVNGVLSSVSTNNDVTTINVKPFEENSITPSSEAKSYKLASDVVISYNGETAAKTALKNGCMVALNIKGGKVKTIDIADKTTYISGTITDIIVSPVFKIVVTDKDGYTDEYMFKDVVTVTRGDKSADASALAKGDMVSLTLEYGIISKVVATTKTNTKTGSVSGIYISDSPELTVTIEGSKETYPISLNATYVIPGVDNPNIYSLRTNTLVTLTIESDTIVKIAATASSESKTITGTVMSVTPAANVFQVSYTDPSLAITQTDSVVVGDKTTIIDTNGKTKKVSDLTIGNTVTIYGTIGSGVIAATTIMIVN
ncbi:MAG: S-layer homology domain-containing protein [Clostridia bacterium]|nr:S-layer homology domain-containing protein [Clostridia bacterium]